MKNSYIIRNLRRALLVQLIFPVLLLLLGWTLLSSFSGADPFQTAVLSQDEPFKDAKLPEGSRIRVQADELCYTGCDYTVGKRLRGHYYYTLINGQCQFYILPAKSGKEAEPVLRGQTVTGRLYRMADGEYSQLLLQMAGDIGWTGSAIRSVSSPYALSGVFRYEYIRLLILPAAAACALIAAFDLCVSLLFIFFPLLSPTFRHLKKYGEVRVLLPKVEMEMKHTRLARAGSIFLTPGYLVNLDTVRTMIFPLECVTRVCLHGHLRRFPGLLGRKFKFSYSLYVTADDGKTYEFAKKKKEDLECILKILERRYPHIFLGYHE